MSGSSSRAKGQRGEREVCDMLNAALRTQFRRELKQYQTGGCDIVDHSERCNFLAIEIKRQETLSLPAWWRQAVSQCREGQVPVLIYRASRQPWAVQMYLSSICASVSSMETITLSLRGFIEWVETKLD